MHVTARNIRLLVVVSALFYLSGCTGVQMPMEMYSLMDCMLCNDRQCHNHIPIQRECIFSCSMLDNCWRARELWPVFSVHTCKASSSCSFSCLISFAEDSFTLLSSRSSSASRALPAAMLARCSPTGRLCSGLLSACRQKASSPERKCRTWAKCCPATSFIRSNWAEGWPGLDTVPMPMPAGSQAHWQ